MRLVNQDSDVRPGAIAPQVALLWKIREEFDTLKEGEKDPLRCVGPVARDVLEDLNDLLLGPL